MHVEIESEKEDFIRLGQALKKAGLVGSGSEAKLVIGEGEVTVNGTVEVRRGRKLRQGDKVSFGGESFEIVS